MCQRSCCPHARLAVCSAAAALAIFLVAADARAQNCGVELSFEHVTVSGGVVHITQSGKSRNARIEEEQLSELPTSETRNDRYRVSFDADSVEFDRGVFRYQFYVQWVDDDVRCPPQRVRVQAAAEGAFNPQQQLVSFSVEGENDNDTGSLVNFPLYNTRTADQHFLVPAAVLESYQLRIGRSTPISIGLTNLLPDLPVTILGVEVDLGNEAYWQAGEGWDDAYRVETHTEEFPGGSTVSEAVEINLRPQPLAVLMDTFLPTAQHDVPHEVVHVRVRYATSVGIARQLEIPVNIRFRPSGVNLFFAVIIGALIGSAIRLTLRADAGVLVWWQVLVLAVLLALVAEVFGVILVNGGSEFRLLTVDLDPVEVLPAALLGAIIGMTRLRRVEEFVASLSGGGGEAA